MGYYILIPDVVRRDNTLTPSAKLLYGDILTKSASTGECWATNRCFSDEYGIGDTQIKKVLRQLQTQGYISVRFEGKGNGVRKISPLVSCVNTDPDTIVAGSEKCPGHKSVSTPVTIVPTEKKREKKNHFPPESNEWQSANYLAQQLDSRKQSGKPTTEADKQRWAADFDKCHRLDGHPWEEIGDVLVWCQQDRFWQGNIRSGATFRKHYDRLAESAIRTGGENYAY